MSTIRRSLGAATAAAALVLGGAASAVASPQPTTEYFLITVGGGSQSVIAHGVFTGGGKDDASHDNYDILHLGGGQLRINHPDKDSHFTYHIDPTSCFVTFKITGTYTLGSGTGRFVNASGNGTYRVKEEGIAPRKSSGACNTNAEPKLLTGYINASGPAMLG
jgi:hypothetical protein